jgi:hypothetical protein
MEERLAALEVRLASLAETVRSLESRVASLDPAGRSVAAPFQGVSATVPLQAASAPPASALPSGAEVIEGGTAFLPLVGRTLLVLGGAFLFRALTDDKVLPPAAGVGLGLLYAVVMGVVADRARGAAGRRSAAFQGLAAAMIGMPLVFEATTRFHVLSPPVAAAFVVVFTAFLVGVAWRRDVQFLGWVAMVGCVGTSFALLWGTQAVATFSVALLVLGVGSLWLTYGRRWHGLRWPAALGADLAVFLMTHVAASPGGLPEGYTDLSIPAVLAIALALPVVYLGSFSARTLSRQRGVNFFEVFQTVISLLAGFGGAVRVARAAGWGSFGLGISALVVAGACYFVAFSFVERRSEFRNNFLFYSSLAVVLTLAVSPLVFGTNVLVLFWCGMAVAGAILGFRLNRLSLAWHSAAYVVASGLVGGLFVAVARTFLGGADHSFALPGRDALVVVAAALAGYTALSVEEARSAGVRRKVDRIPIALLGVVALFGIGGGAVDLLALVFGGPAAAGAAKLATIRTVVLSTAAIGLAWARRRAFFADLVWLAYPVLIAGGLKLLLEDLRTSGPAALVVAFGFFGAALILVPRLLRGGVPVAGKSA